MFFLFCPFLSFAGVKDTEERRRKVWETERGEIGDTKPKNNNFYFVFIWVVFQSTVVKRVNQRFDASGKRIGRWVTVRYELWLWPSPLSNGQKKKRKIGFSAVVSLYVFSCPSWHQSAMPTWLPSRGSLGSSRHRVGSTDGCNWWVSVSKLQLWA